MSVVEQALLKLVENQPRPSNIGTRHRPDEPVSEVSADGSEVAGPAPPPTGSQRTVRDASDGLAVPPFAMPSTITTLDDRASDVPEPTTARADAAVKNHEPRAATPETDLQIAGLRAACATRTDSIGESRVETASATTMAPKFVATTFRFDPPHVPRVPTAHLLPLSKHQQAEQAAVENEETAEQLRSETDTALDAADAARDDQPGTAGKPPQTGFKAAFEVDQFLWPPLCESLTAAVSADIKAAARRVLDATRNGQNVVAVAGLPGASGCTTFVLCLAQQLAALDASVLVVDANFDHPSLAQSLRIQCQLGWNQDSSRPADSAETLIESLEDRITIAPLNELESNVSPQTIRRNWRVLIKGGRQHFDVVLVDAAPLERSLSSRSFAIFQDGAVDHVILLQPDSQASSRTLAGPVRSLLAAGVAPLGIVRNAHSAGAPAQH